MRAHFVKASLFLSIALLAACASNKTSTPAPTAAAPAPTPAAAAPAAAPAAQNVPKQQVMAAVPADSPFSKIKVGMGNKQVHDLIGAPTDTAHYTTGKAFIPFYFGNDVMRSEDIYKGQGRIVYTGAGVGGVDLRVNQIIYDPNEDGYRN